MSPLRRERLRSGPWSAVESRRFARVTLIVVCVVHLVLVLSGTQFLAQSETTLFIPCVNISNSSSSPTIVSSNTTLVVSDCITADALSTWSVTSVMQIRLGTPTDTALRNVYLEIRGGSYFMPPNITMAGNLTIVSNISIILDGLVPGGNSAGAVSSLPVLGYAIVQFDALLASVTDVNLTLSNTSLVGVRGSTLPCWICFNVSNMSRISVHAANVVLPVVATSFPTISMMFLGAKFGITALHVVINNLTPMYVANATFTMPNETIDLAGWILDSLFPFGDVSHIVFQLNNVTLPTSPAAVRFETGNPNSNPTRNGSSNRGGVLSTVTMTWNDTTLLNTTGHWVALRALITQDISIRFFHTTLVRGISSNAAANAATAWGNVSIAQTSIAAFAYIEPNNINAASSLSRVRRVRIEVHDYTIAAYVRYPALEIASTITVNGVSLIMRRIRTIHAASSGLAMSSTSTVPPTYIVNEFFFRTKIDVAVQNFTLIVQDAELVNVKSVDHLGYLTARKIENISILLQRVAIDGTFKSTFFALLRDVGTFSLMPNMVVALDNVRVNVSCVIYQGDCSLFRTIGDYRDTLSGVDLSLTNSDILWSAVCPVGYDCSSSIAVFEVIDGRWTSGLLRVRNSSVEITTSAMNRTDPGAGVRATGVFYLRGAPVTDVTNGDGPFRNCTAEFENVQVSMKAPLGAFVRFVGAVGVDGFLFRYTNVTLNAVFSEAVFDNDILSYSPNFALMSCTIPMQNGIIILHRTTLTASGVGGVPSDLVGTSYAQSVAVFSVIVAQITNVSIQVTESLLDVNVANGTITRLTQLDVFGTMIIAQINFALVMVQPFLKQCVDIHIVVLNSTVSAAGDAQADPNAKVGAVSVAVTAVQLSNCSHCRIEVRNVELEIHRATVRRSADSRLIESMPYAVAVFAQSIGGFVAQTIVNPFVNLVFVNLGLDAPSFYSNVHVVVDNITIRNTIPLQTASSSSDLFQTHQQPLLAVFSPPTICSDSTTISVSRITFVDPPHPLNVTTFTTATTNAVARAPILCGVSCQLRSNTTVAVNSVTGAYPGVIVTTRGQSVFDATVTPLCGDQLIVVLIESMPYAVAVFAQSIGGFVAQTIVNPFVNLVFVNLGLDAPSFYSNVHVVVDNITIRNTIPLQTASSSSDLFQTHQQPLLAVFSPPTICSDSTTISVSRITFVDPPHPLNVTTFTTATTNAVARAPILCGVSCQLRSNTTVAVNSVTGAYPGVIVTTRGQSVFDATVTLSITDTFITCNNNNNNNNNNNVPSTNSGAGVVGSSSSSSVCGLLVSLPNAFSPLSLHSVSTPGTASVIFPSNLTIAGSMFLHRNRLVGFQAITTTVVQLSLTSSAFLQQAVQVDASTATLLLGCNLVDGVRFPSTSMSRGAMRTALGNYPPSVVTESPLHTSFGAATCRWANWTATREVVPPATTQLLDSRPYDKAAGGALWVGLATGPLSHTGMGGGLASLQSAVSLLQLRRRCAALTDQENTGVDGPDDVALGDALSENPLQLVVPELGPQPGAAAGAVIGNLVVIVVAGGLSYTLRALARRGLSRAASTKDDSVPQRVCRALTDIIPQSPASLLVPSLLLLQPLAACAVFLWASAASEGAHLPGALAVVGVLGGAFCVLFTAAVAWKLLWSWRSDGSTKFPLRTVPNRQFLARRSVASLRMRVMVLLFTPSAVWVQPQTAASSKERGWSRYALLFEGYVARRHWFLLVELAFGFANGVASGAMAFAGSSVGSDDADAACAAAQAGGWVLVSLAVAQLAAIALLRPYAVLMDTASNVAILACSLLSEVIVLLSSASSNSAAADALLLVASVVQGIAILSTVLIDVVGYLRHHGSSLWAAGVMSFVFFFFLLLVVGRRGDERWATTTSVAEYFSSA
ncbi:membrane-associated protein, putative [Bodo saltans]|uniref:Membrane-associated protein, putative n=1 Tax=Bodo saltans TaxID=75058 RepID=A0A0S4J1I1_BODSA|nr:membrane-associated protein, putative [Bodo saltans]|eukprot:CUG50541.1 membrane-associated protein, putative [Bodo saltans]